MEAINYNEAELKETTTAWLNPEAEEEQPEQFPARRVLTSAERKKLRAKGKRQRQARKIARKNK